MRKIYMVDEVNPITNQRINEYNVVLTEKLVKGLRGSYSRAVYQPEKQANRKIIDCYEKAWLCNKLYECLMEKDPERMRGAIQRLADEHLDDIISGLVELGYVF